LCENSPIGMGAAARFCAAMTENGINIVINNNTATAVVLVWVFIMHPYPCDRNGLIFQVKPAVEIR